MRMMILLLALLFPVLGSAQPSNPLPLPNSWAILQASGAQTATFATPNQQNVGYSRGHFLINVSAYTSGNFTPKIQGMDPVSGNFYDILVGPAISATGLTVLKVCPGCPGTANAITNDILPQTWRVQMVGASSPSMTLSISYYLNQ